ncbi:hypothetical protein DDE18_22310 [Nocardioides gansuensis]|uniref:GH16 domain-containing protein n=2 Tax=Nocardioides gansuensis TaxID=2138300 RepID=A0A2T8F4I3_9ACTN|nr:hypothetical protein DDE18_22310 [Nocardioides gansuensis]
MKHRTARALATRPTAALAAALLLGLSLVGAVRATDPAAVGTSATGSAVAVAAAGSTSAAKKFGWGRPVAREEFNYTGAPRSRKWGVYDSPGHDDNGLRRPRAWHVNGHVARVVGNSRGVTGGMSARFGNRRYGRWEVRMKTNQRDSEYHPVLLLWPDSGDWPCDGEIDYAEGGSDWREIHFFLHYSCDNSQESETRKVDTTKWHNYAVEWTPDGIVGYLDGVPWFRDTDPEHQPPGPMHQTVQLDWFPDGTETTRSWMKIAWVRVYDVPTG